MLGSLGEFILKKYFISKGFSLIYQGYQTKFGEIDLIFSSSQTLYFVESKLTTSSLSSSYSAWHKKQSQNLYKAAQLFLKKEQIYRNNSIQVLFSELNFSQKDYITWNIYPVDINKKFLKRAI